jgi:hypothetical protein
MLPHPPEVSLIIKELILENPWHPACPRDGEWKYVREMELKTTEC